MAPFLLDVQNLTVLYSSPTGSARAVCNVSFKVAQGETVALVGETGCGKSTIALALLGLLDSHARLETGRILFAGRDLAAFSEKQWRSIRGRDIGLVFQDARSALNPILTIGEHLIETLRSHRKMTRTEAKTAAQSLLAEVGIPDPEFSMRRYPLEFSGGMCQRIGIALAICNRPRLLIADEPTSALDPTLQAQVLALLNEMKARHNLAFLLISHDLAMVSEFADRVAVMYLGRIVECGAAGSVFSSPAHPYTQGLLRSQPGLNHHREHEPLQPIPGAPPLPGQIVAGCAFAPRCPISAQQCALEVPDLTEISQDHQAACLKIAGGWREAGG